MQKRFGLANGPLKTAICHGNTARLYGLATQAEPTRHDRFATLKADCVAKPAWTARRCAGVRRAASQAGAARADNRSPPSAA